LIIFDTKNKKLSFAIAVKSLEELKTFKILLEPETIKNILNKKYDFENLNYQNITKLIE